MLGPKISPYVFAVVRNDGVQQNELYSHKALNKAPIHALNRSSIHISRCLQLIEASSECLMKLHSSKE